MEFCDIFNKQISFQNDVIVKKGYKQLVDKSNIELPMDNVDLASYHIQALMAEVGELLHSDKRWKNYRVDNIDMENKKEEIADCFIVLMNIAIYSGLSAEEFEKVILNKIEENNKRISDA